MKPEPLDLEEIKIPDNKLTRACMNIIVRGLTENEKQVDTKEEALSIIFDLLEEYKNSSRGSGQTKRR